MKIISFDDSMELHHCTTMEEDGDRKQKDRLLVHLPTAIEKELTERQRQMVIMHFYQKKGVSQIARELQLNPSTVSRTLRRATQRLRHILDYFV